MIFFSALVDKDNEIKESPKGIFKINRYCLENYLFDPLLIFAVFIESDIKIQIPGINYNRSNISYMKKDSSENLQKIANTILSKIEDDIEDEKMKARADVTFISGQKLSYPLWMIELNGKKIRTLYNSKNIGGSKLNNNNLLRELERTGLIPNDFLEIFHSIQDLTSNMEKNEKLNLASVI